MASTSNAQNTGCHIWLEVNKNVFRGYVKLLWPNQPGYSTAETVTLSIMKSVVDAYVGQEYQPRRIILHSKLRDLGFKPDAAYGDTPLELGKPHCALEYPSALLSHCRSSVAKVRHHPLEKAPESIAQTMSECLKPYLRNGYPSIAFAAELMHCSSRSLQRVLKDENTSYTRVVDGARLSMSIQLMRETEMSLGEICHELGYSELSAFSRAFHNWTGLAPSVYRTIKN
jgi:AraC-like DNA-binding protein